MYTEDNKIFFKLRRKIKGLINELHWKIISFLVENYDHILLPDFKIQNIINKEKNKNLSKTTRRLLSELSFYRFKEKLKYKCSCYGKKLYIVDESFTSKTCGNCGTLNDVGGSDVFSCSSCKVLGDRDGLASRNILIKNVTLRSGGSANSGFS